jgi:dTDP-4-amino-4,6-dideoxygalactose transaminase
LPQQFARVDEILALIRDFVPTGDFTLGKPVAEFEARFAALIGARFAIGVNSGTDALKLALRAVGVGHGDEVITTANTFIATVGAIAELGARPVFVDCRDDFCMDVAQIAGVITPRTKAILPVHLAGQMTDMTRVMPIAEENGLAVVEDACQCILGEIEGRRAGTFGDAAGFSLHPLKNLNVWGDGGVIVTNNADIDAHLRLLRNHGLKNRDDVALLGHNSRLDSLQAVIGNWLIGQVHEITDKRIANAARIDRGLSSVPQIRIPPRASGRKLVYHLYILFAEDRDGLLRHCVDRGVEAKVHYPIPVYRQPGLAHLGYKAGDFPVTDRHAESMISLPAHDHLSADQLDYMIATVREYYGR